MSGISRFAPGCAAAGCKARSFTNGSCSNGIRSIHIQLDELWANVKHSTQDMWVWVVSDATSKIFPVIQLGGRTQEMAYHVVHEIKERLCAQAAYLCSAQMGSSITFTLLCTVVRINRSLWQVGNRGGQKVRLDLGE